MAEIKPIPGYPGYYADDTGCIWSMRGRWTTGMVRKIQRVVDGYWVVDVLKDGADRLRPVKAHALVNRAFNGPPATGAETLHDDGNGLNNVPSNLRWGTRRENIADAKRHGTLAHGERCGRAKLKAQAVIEIRRLRQCGVGVRELARQFGTSDSNVCAITLRQSWRDLE